MSSGCKSAVANSESFSFPFFYILFLPLLPTLLPLAFTPAFFLFSPYSHPFFLYLLLQHFSFSSPYSQPSSQCLQAHPTALGGSLSFFFLFLFFPQLPTLFPPGKGPFASLARLPVSPPPPSSPSLKSGGPFFSSLFFFLLTLIDMGFV